MSYEYVRITRCRRAHATHTPRSVGDTDVRYQYDRTSTKPDGFGRNAVFQLSPRIRGTRSPTTSQSIGRGALVETRRPQCRRHNKGERTLARNSLLYVGNLVPGDSSGTTNGHGTTNAVSLSKHRFRIAR